MEYIWDVEIPEGEEIVDMGDKLKAHKIILSNYTYHESYDRTLEEAIKILN